jgi:hypothetical protein
MDDALRGRKLAKLPTRANQDRDNPEPLEMPDIFNGCSPFVARRS